MEKIPKKDEEHPSIVEEAVYILGRSKKRVLFSSISTILEVFRRGRGAFGASIHHRSTSPLPPPSPRRVPMGFKAECRGHDGSPLGESERGREGTVVRWQKCRRKVDVAVGFHFDVGRSDVCRLEDFLRRKRE